MRNAKKNRKVTMDAQKIAMEGKAELDAEPHERKKDEDEHKNDDERQQKREETHKRARQDPQNDVATCGLPQKRVNQVESESKEEEKKEARTKANGEAMATAEKVASESEGQAKKEAMTKADGEAALAMESSSSIGWPRPRGSITASCGTAGDWPSDVGRKIPRAAATAPAG